MREFRISVEHNVGHRRIRSTLVVEADLFDHATGKVKRLFRGSDPVVMSVETELPQPEPTLFAEAP